MAAASTGGWMTRASRSHARRMRSRTNSLFAASDPRKPPRDGRRRGGRPAPVPRGAPRCGCRGRAPTGSGRECARRRTSAPALRAEPGVVREDVAARDHPVGFPVAPAPAPGARHHRERRAPCGP
jgi:hypothetical protein